MKRNCRIPYGFTIRKRLLSILMAVIMTVGYMPLMNFGPTNVWAEADDEPDHLKILQANEDGTYTLGLNVVGDSEKKVNKTNVTIILDASNSMYVNPANNGSSNQNRMEATLDVMESVAETLLNYNMVQGNPDDTVEVSLLVFANEANTRIAVPPTTDYNTFKGTTNTPNCAEYYRRDHDYHGTNWEAALNLVPTVEYNDQDPTYVIFFTDGEPTQYVNQQGNGYDTNASFPPSLDPAKSIVDAKEVLYSIIAFGNDTGKDLLNRLTNYAYTGDQYGTPPGDYYYAPDNASELEAVFNKILSEIEMAGIGSVKIQDGTTSSVSTSTGDISLLTVDESSYKYYRAGGVDEDGKEKYDSDANKMTYSVVSETGTETKTEYIGEEWIGAPEASFENGAVKWDLGENIVLENDVKYTVTFDCWPSQTTLDIVADIKNDPDAYDKLDANIKKYIDKNGNLKTNTDAFMTYVDTRTGESNNKAFDNPDPVSNLAVEQLAISKKWENELDALKANPVDLSVTRDGSPTYTVKLPNKNNEWKNNVFISTGIMRADADGSNVELLTTGHEFTFLEPPETEYYWELKIPTVRPMILNGTLSTLIKIDDDHPLPSGKVKYTLPSQDNVPGGDYYIDDETDEVKLTAVNERRSNLNVTKIVDGVDIPEDASFPFTLNVKNSKEADGTQENINSDYWIWFSVDNEGFQDRMVSDNVQKEITEDPEKMIDDTGWTGYYFAPSGNDVVFDLMQGDNLRVLNLPTDTTYTISESLESGYKFDSAVLSGGDDESFSGNVTSTGTITETNKNYLVTYTNKYELIDINVNKVWDDNNNQDGKRPETLVLNLNGLPQGVSAPTPEITKSADGNIWTYTWKAVPRYDSQGNENSYTVSENTVPNGYECTGSPANDGGIITNIHTPETTEATVKKVWDDANNQDGKRPTELKVTLSNGTEVTLNEANKWTATVDNLPKFAAGQEIKYTWTEGDLPEGYELTDTSVNGTVTTLTNSYTPEKTQVNGSKTWNDQELLGKNGYVRPSSITVNLLADGKKIDSTTVKADSDGNWNYSFTDLPKYKDGGKKIVYTIKEETVDGYATVINGYNLINTPETEEVLNPTELIIKKIDSNTNTGTGLKGAKFELTGPEGESSTVEAFETDETGQIKIPFKMDGTYTLKETKAPDGYRVSETAAAGYTVKVEKSLVEVKLNTDKTLWQMIYDLIFDEATKAQFDENTVTLTVPDPPETTEATVKKVWDDANNQDGKRPTELKVTLSNGTEVTLNDANKWTATVDNLPKYADGQEVEYTWTEGALPIGYTLTGTSTEGNVTTLTNKYDPEKTAATVKKVWNDVNNQDGKRPTELKVTLSNGTEVTLNEANKWTATVDNLPKFAAGQEIKYTWTEGDLPEGYELTDTSVNGTVTTLTNSYTPEKDKITVTKVWNDASDQDGKRPESVKFTVSGSDGKTYEATLSGEGDKWTKEVEVEKYYNSGKEVTFKVDEEEVAEYEKTIDNDKLTITNTYKPEKDKITVTKVWNDASDQDGKRPESVEFTVSGSDGKTYGATLSGEGDKWTKEVEVEKYYNSGKEVTFKVDEEEVAEYEKKIDNDKLTITNTYKPEKDKKTVTKVWDDASDQDGKRPESVKFTLTGSDGKTYEATLSGEEDTWTREVEVEKYYNGGQEVTFKVDEEEVAEYEKKIDNDKLTITNTYKPEKDKKTVTKVWDDASDQDGKRPESVKFTLTGSDGKTYEATLSGEEDTWTQEVEVEKYYNGGQEVTFKVDEEEVAEYEKKIDNDKLTITNSYKPEITKVDVTKIWNDNNDKDKKRPESILIRLMAEGFESEFANKVITEKENWTWTFTGLDKFKDGEPILYYIVEDAIEEYTTSITGDMKNGFTVTNSRQSKPVKTVYTGSVTDNIDGQEVQPGQELTYQIDYLNTTGEKADKVEITDKIPAHTTFVEGSADNGGTESNGTVTWIIPNIENGQSVKVTFKVKVDDLADGEKLKNTGIVRVGNNTYNTNEVINYIPSDPVKDVFAASDPTTSIDGKQVKPGDKLTYTITYKNTTGEKVDGVIITDKIPDYTTFDSADNGGTESDGTITWTLPEMKNGESITVKFDVTVNSDADGQTLKNKAKAKVGENEYDTNEVTNYIPSEPKKEVYKEGDTTTMIDGQMVKPGDKLTYTITYKNTTGEKVDGVVITDKIPNYTTFESADNGGTESDGTVTWTLPELENGESQTVTMVVAVDESADGVELKNKGIVRVGENTYNTNEVTNYIPSGPVKDVFAASDPTTSIDGKQVKPGDKLTYTITYKNTTGEKVDGVIITDKIPDYTIFDSADNGGTESDGTITWTLPEMKNGESITVKFDVTVDSDADGQTLKNKAKAKVGENEYDTNEVTNYIPSEPKKEVYKEGDTTTMIDGQIVKPGDKLTYTITYKNTTGEKVDGVVITDKIPNYTTFESADNGGTELDGTVTWTLPELENGESQTVTMVVAVDESADGVELKNKGIVRVGENTYNTNEVTNYIPSGPKKEVFAASDPTTSIDGKQVKPGDKLTYTITYKNTTGEKVDGVIITDKIPDYTIFDSADNGGTESDGTITWTLPEMKNGESITVKFDVTVDSDADGQTLKNKAKAKVGENEYDTNEVTNYIPSEPKKEVYKEGDTTTMIDGQIVNPGDKLTYTITYKNTTGEKVDGVIITDKIPDYTTYVEGSADYDGKEADGTITWTLPEMKNGESVVVSFLVSVNNDAIGVELKNKGRVRVGKNEYDTNEVTNYIPSDPTKDVFAESDPKISIDGKQVKPGDRLTYTITYKNTTGAKADVVITDQIPAYTSFVSANYSGIEAGGTVLWNLKDVGVGDSRVLNLVVVVNDDAEGQTLRNKAKVLVGQNEYETNEVTNYIPTDPVKEVYFEKDPETMINGEYVDALDVLLYKVTYTNTTGEDVEATITDSIPEFTAYVDGSADHDGAYADGKLTWNVKVAKDDSVTVSFKVQVNEDVDGDTVINKAVVRVGENDYETNEVINPTTEHILDTDNHFGYIIGYPVDYETGEKTDDKNRWPVRPTADITRAEVSTVFFRMLRDEKRSEYWTKENDFSDVSKSNWYNNAISVMASLGILKGYNDGTFQPNKAITRAEMAAIAARFARMTGADVTTTNTFTDIEGHWAKKEIEFAAAVGWINGYPDGSFHPQDNITRAEFMTLANRMLERQPELESDLLKDEMIAWPDNLPSDWWYLAVQEATNSHKYIRKGVTVPNLTFEYESWIEMLEMRDWSAFEKEWSDANSASNPGDIVSGDGE